MDKFLRIVIAAVAFGVGAAGCATTSDAAPERLPDGTYRLKCSTSLSRCLDRADEVCRAPGVVPGSLFLRAMRLSPTSALADDGARRDVSELAWRGHF